MQTRHEAHSASRIEAPARGLLTPLVPPSGPLVVTAGRSALAELCWQIGTTTLFMVAAVSGLAALVLLCGGSLGRIEASVILIAAVALAVLLPRAASREHWRVVSASVLAIAVVAIAVSLLVIDTSIDGQDYHFQAIYALTRGWNPYWNPGIPEVLGEQARPWVLHYPKAAWLFDASLVGAGLPLEATKAINIMLLASGALMLFGALGWLKMSWPARIALTAAAALNPVALVQLFTRMNDGLMASCVLIFIVAVVVWIALDDRKAFFAAAASMMIALNLKFSAIPLFVLFCGAAVAGAFVFKGWRDARSIALHLLAAGFAGLAVFGWAPYVTNLWYFGHPLYPLMGSGPADIMAANTPEVLTGLSAPARFLYSLFATTHAGYETLPHLKLPLTVSLAEIRAAGSAPDPRIGGFGPLFSAAIIVAIAALALLLASARRSAGAGWLSFIAAVLLLSALLMPENWWARYIPALWLMPAVVALAALLSRERTHNTAGWIITVLMLANAVLVSGVSTAFAVKRSLAANEQITALRREAGHYCVVPGYAKSRLVLMRAAGIDVKLVPEEAPPGCADPQSIAAFGPDREGGQICPCPAQ